MPAHRRVRSARPVVAGRVVLSGAAVLGLGAGPLVGIASAAPAAHTTCGSYQYQEDAQAALRAGGHGNLDGDHDGIACEALPHRGSSTTPVAAKPATPKPVTPQAGTQHAGTATRPASSTPARTARPAINDLDCGDFTSRAEAQRVLDRDHSDPNRLDADHDGVACESYDYGHGSATAAVRSVADTAASTSTGSSAEATGSTTAGPVDTTAADVPVGAVAAGDGSTDGSTGSALWYGLLGSAAVAGAAGAHQFVGGRRRRA